MRYRITSFVLFLVLVGHDLLAQDTLVYRNGERIIGQVQEIGSGAVRYSTTSGPNTVLVSVDKNELVRVTLQNGQAFYFNGGPTSEATPGFLDRRNLIALDVIAPALDHLTVGYERVCSEKVNLRAYLGYIGLWRSNSDRERLPNRGWLVRVGPKFRLPRGEKRIPAVRDLHPLAGWYLSPELLASYWVRPQEYASYAPYWEPYEYIIREEYHASAAIHLTIGRQVVLGEHFTFDLHGGIGYGVRWLNGIALGWSDQYSYDGLNYRYSHAFLGRRSPVSVNGGINFGYFF